ncbi:ribonucleoside-diphosphate reductase subunit alpha [Leptolyngbya sp. AN03gr2]|uniref:ribonucleoside-diphosphate reductase subunit alpha n=1 Tax=Leptolyngbya sp. AN03gr2 TaxID=3423364 RepID=UPI003D3173FA
MTDLQQLIELGKAPSWMTTEGYTTLRGGYLLEGEEPVDMYRRVANAAARRLKRADLEDPFFNLMWRGWLGLATPVAANMGTERGLPISCYALYVEDDMTAIRESWNEVAALSSKGGGVAVHLNDIRAKGSSIGSGGKSEGVVPWAKVYDSITIAVSQNAVRRGATALYLDAEHGDIEEFLRIRRPLGDVNRQCLNVHHGVSISDDFMNRVKSGDSEARRIWADILKTRVETGEPYLFFSDNVNNANPQCYKDKGLFVLGSNLCTEVFGVTDKEHSFVCCLSSMNLAKRDEWKNTDAVYLATLFLDAVMEEFIIKAKKIPGFERAVNFAMKSRMLGLGVMGYHTYLQEHSIPFESEQAQSLNQEIFQSLQEQTQRASRDLAKEYGEPEWCKGYGIRNTHLTACAPTKSNSLICGNVSAGIEPIAANYILKKEAKGDFIYRNPTLAKLLQDLGKDTPETWQQILNDGGSVQSLDFLIDHQKEVFKTAREIDQMELVQQAAARQPYIDQGQSLNLFFRIGEDPNVINRVHFTAWKAGLKTLYYCRSEEAQKVRTTAVSTTEAAACSIENKDDCLACQG